MGRIFGRISGFLGFPFRSRPREFINRSCHPHGLSERRAGSSGPALWTESGHFELNSWAGIFVGFSDFRIFIWGFPNAGLIVQDVHYGLIMFICC